MNLLVKHELVNARKDGSWMRYTLNDVTFNELKSFLEMITTTKTDCICK